MKDKNGPNITDAERQSLCKLLQLAYPDTNRAILKLSDLYQLIIQLPDYNDWEKPSERELQNILWQWMRHIGEEAAC